MPGPVIRHPRPVSPIRRPVALVMLVMLVACGSEARPPARRPALPELPSTGVYAVTATVLGDTCEPAYVAPPPWRSFVEARAGRDSARLDFSASAIPPETRTDLPSRKSLSIIPPEVEYRERMIPDFPAAIDATVLEISRYARDGFTLAITVRDGMVNGPGCETRIEHDFRVVEPMCAAACTRAVKPGSVEPSFGEPPRMHVECECH